MSSRKTKKRFGSSRHLRERNREIEEKENDDGFPDTGNQEQDSEQSQLHTVSESQVSNESSLLHSDQPVIACTNPSTSVFKLCPDPQSEDLKDLLGQAEATSKKIKMGSTRKGNRNLKLKDIYEDEPENRPQLSEGVSDEQELTSEASIKKDKGEESQTSLSDCTPSQSSEHESSILQEQHLTHGTIIHNEDNGKKDEHQHLETVLQSKPEDISSSELNQSEDAEFCQHLLHASLDFSIITPTECNVLPQELDESLQLYHKVETEIPLNESRDESQDVQMLSVNEQTVLKSMDNQSSLNLNISDKQEDKQQRENANTLEGCSADDIIKDEDTRGRLASLINEHEHGTQDVKVATDLWQYVSTRASIEDDHTPEYKDGTLMLDKESIHESNSTEITKDTDEYKEVSVAGKRTDNYSHEGVAETNPNHAMDPDRNIISPLKLKNQEAETSSDQFLSYEFNFQSEIKSYRKEQYDLSKARCCTGESSADEDIGEKDVDMLYDEEEKYSMIGTKEEVKNDNILSTTSNQFSKANSTIIVDLATESELIPAETMYEASSQTCKFQHNNLWECSTELVTQSKERDCSDQMHDSVIIDRSDFLDIEAEVIEQENIGINEEINANSTENSTKEHFTSVEDKKDGMPIFMNKHEMATVITNAQIYKSNPVTEQATMVVKSVHDIENPVYGYNTTDTMELIPKSEVKLDMQVYNAIAMHDQKQNISEKCVVKPTNRESEAEQLESTTTTVYIQESKLVQDDALAESMRFIPSEKKQIDSTETLGLITEDDQKDSFKAMKEEIQVKSIEENTPVSEEGTLSITESCFSQSADSLNIVETEAEIIEENIIKVVCTNDNTISVNVNRNKECGALDRQDEEAVRVKNSCIGEDSTHTVLSDVHEHVADTGVHKLQNKPKDPENELNEQITCEDDIYGKPISVENPCQSTDLDLELGHSKLSELTEFATVTINTDHLMTCDKPMNAGDGSEAHEVEKDVAFTETATLLGPEYNASMVSQTTIEHPSPAKEIDHFKEDDGDNTENVENSNEEVHMQAQTKKRKKFGSTRKPHRKHQAQAEEEEEELKNPVNTEEIEQQFITQSVTSNLLTEAQNTMSEVTLDIHDSPITPEAGIVTGEIDAPSAIVSTEVDQIHTVASDELSNAERPTDIKEQNEKTGVNEEKDAESMILNELEMAPFVIRLQDDAFMEHVSDKQMDTAHIHPDVSDQDESLTKEHRENPFNREPEPEQFESQNQEPKSAQDHEINKNVEFSSSEQSRKIGSTRRSKRHIQEQNIDQKDNNTEDIMDENNDTKKEINVGLTENFTEDNNTTEHSQQSMLSELSSHITDLSLTVKHPSPATDCAGLKEDGGNSIQNVKNTNAEIYNQTQTKKKKKFGSTRRQHGKHTEGEVGEEKDLENLKEFKYQFITQGVTSDLLTDPQKTMTEVILDIRDSESVTTEKNRITKTEAGIVTGEIDAPSAIVSTEVDQIHTVASDELSNAERPTDIKEKNKKTGVNEEKDAESMILNELEMAPFVITLQDDAFMEHVSDMQMDTAHIHPDVSDQDESLTKEHRENPFNREPEPEQFESMSSFVQIQEPKSAQDHEMNENVEFSSSEQRRKIGSTRRSLRGQVPGSDQKNRFEEIKEKESTQEQNIEKNSNEDIKNETNDAEDRNAGLTGNFTEVDITTVSSQQYALSELSSQTAELDLTGIKYPSPATQPPDSMEDDENSMKNVQKVNVEILTKKKKKFGSTRRPHGKHQAQAEEEEGEWKDPVNTEEIMIRGATSNLLTEPQNTMNEGTLDIHDFESVTTEQKLIIKSQVEILTAESNVQPAILSTDIDQIHTMNLGLTTIEYSSSATDHPDFKEEGGRSLENVGNDHAEIHKQTQTKKKKKFGSTRRPHGKHQPQAEEEEGQWEDVDNTEKMQIIDQAASSDLLTELQDVISELPLDDLKPSLKAEQGVVFTGNESANQLVYPTHGLMECLPQTQTVLDMPVVSEQYHTMSQLENSQNTESKPEQCESTCSVVHVEKLTSALDDMATQNSGDSNSGRRKKLGSTRRSHGVTKEKENIQEEIIEESTPTPEKDQAIQIHSEPLNFVEPEAEKLSLTSENLDYEQSIQDTWQENEEINPRYAEDINREYLKLVVIDDMPNPDSNFYDIETRVQVHEPQIPDQAEGSLLSEIELYLNKSYESNLNNTALNPNKSEFSETTSEESLQLASTQNPQLHTDLSSPARRRKMGSSRKVSRKKHTDNISNERRGSEQENENLDMNNPNTSETKREAMTVDEMAKGTGDIKESVELMSEVQALSQLNDIGSQDKGQPLQEGRRKFGSRLTAKGSSGLGTFTHGDYESNQKITDVQVTKDDIRVSELEHTPQGTPISQPVSEPRPESVVKNPKASTEAGLVSLDKIGKSPTGVVSTCGRQKIDYEQWNEQIPDFELAVYNVVMVGNSNVGKTSFIKRLQSGHFIPDYSATIGIDTFVHTVTFGSSTVKLFVWDTAGQERYHSITRQVFHKAQGLLLMYDVTSSQSFQAVRAWISQIQEKAPPDAILMLLGNKNDNAHREVPLKDGEDLSKEYNIQFMECSAATGENVSESLKTLAWLLVKQRVRKEEENISLQPKPQNKKSGCC